MYSDASRRHTYPRICPPTLSAPPERFWYYYECGSNIASKHARKHEARPPQPNNKFCLDSNNVGLFVLAQAMWYTRHDLNCLLQTYWHMTHQRKWRNQLWQTECGKTNGRTLGQSSAGDYLQAEHRPRPYQPRPLYQVRSWSVRALPLLSIVQELCESRWPSWAVRPKARS